VSIKAGELQYSFRGVNGHSALEHRFREGQPIVAMIDYCYEGTSHVMADFLGYPARTPTGVFAFARRHEYRISVMTWRDGAIVVADSFDAASASIEVNVQRVNTTVEREILARPERWLLWPSVDRRWSGVDYELGAARP
jgi:lauroyl/myristoyl acyltransferase